MADCRECLRKTVPDSAVTGSNDTIMATNEIFIPLGEVKLGGELNLPPDALGLVLFAHGSGSSRSSPRNQFVARTLREKKVGTLLFDLLTAEEEQAEDAPAADEPAGEAPAAEEAPGNGDPESES